MGDLGYVASGPVDEEFMAVWRVGCGIANLVAMLYSPEYQAAATEELDQILKEIAFRPLALEILITFRGKSWV